MPTETTISQRDTWRDWFPDADEVTQVTLEELLETLIWPRLQPGERVTADTVRYWQKAGVLPQPIKRWHEGATRALYPRGYAFMAIFHILALQEKGYTLQQIAVRLRREFMVMNIRQDDPKKWRDTARRLAAEYAEMTGNTPHAVQITFFDDEGNEEMFSYRVGSDNNER